MRTATQRWADTWYPLLADMVGLAFGWELGRAAASMMSQPPEGFVRAVRPSADEVEDVERWATPLLSPTCRRHWRWLFRQHLRQECGAPPAPLQPLFQALRAAARSLPPTAKARKLAEVFDEYETRRRELVEGEDIGALRPDSVIRDKRVLHRLMQEVGENLEATLRSYFWVFSDPLEVKRMAATGEFRGLGQELLRMLGLPADPEEALGILSRRVAEVLEAGLTSLYPDPVQRALEEACKEVYGFTLPRYVLATTHPREGELPSGGRRLVAEDVVEKTLSLVTSPEAPARRRGNWLLRQLKETASLAFDEAEVRADLPHRICRMRELSRTAREKQACEVFEKAIGPMLSLRESDGSPLALEKAPGFPDACRLLGYTDPNDQRSIRRALKRLLDRTK